jgi:hypothetical protein
MNQVSPAKQWEAFLARFNPGIVSLVKAALALMRKRVPGAVEMVYDNYNALVIGFGPSERASEAVFSLAIYPNWVNLFFLRGASLDDPKRLLKGGGRVVRHIRLSSPALIDDPPVRDLMKRALALAPVSIDPRAKRRMVIRSISAKLRPRKP